MWCTTERRTGNCPRKCNCYFCRVGIKKGLIIIIIIIITDSPESLPIWLSSGTHSLTITLPPMNASLKTKEFWEGIYFFPEFLHQNSNFTSSYICHRRRIFPATGLQLRWGCRRSAQSVAFDADRICRWGWGSTFAICSAVCSADWRSPPGSVRDHRG